MSVLVSVAIEGSIQFYIGPLTIFTLETQEFIQKKCPIDIVYNDYCQNSVFEEEIANATINLDKEGQSKMKPILDNNFLKDELYLVGMTVIT